MQLSIIDGQTIVANHQLINSLHFSQAMYETEWQTQTDLEKYLDDSCDYGEFGEFNFTEDLYSFIEQFLYIAK